MTPQQLAADLGLDPADPVVLDTCTTLAKRLSEPDESMPGYSLAQLATLDLELKQSHSRYEDFQRVRLALWERGYKCTVCSAYHHAGCKRHGDCGPCRTKLIIPREDLPPRVFTLIRPVA